MSNNQQGLDMVSAVMLFEMYERDQAKYERFMKFLAEDYTPKLMKIASVAIAELRKEFQI